MYNNILNILNSKGISIRKMSTDLDITYSVAHALATKEDLSHTPIGRIVAIANYLDVDIKELYMNKKEWGVLRMKNMTSREKAIMINEYIEKVYGEEIEKIGEQAKGNVSVYENSSDFITNLESLTGETYNYNNASKHFNEIVATSYTGDTNTEINDTECILIAVDSTESNTIDFHEVGEEDFKEVYEQMASGPTERYPGEDEEDTAHYGSIEIDSFLTDRISNLVTVNSNKELNGYEKEI